MKYRCIILFTLAAAFLVSCGSRQAPPLVSSRFLMDTVVNISIYDSSSSNIPVKKAIEHAFKIMEEVEKLASSHLEESELSLINRTAGSSRQKVSPELLYLLEKSREVSEQSDGAFDITIGPLKKLWNFESDHPRVPDSLAIREALKGIGYKNLLLQQDYLSFKSKGMSLDRAVDVLRKSGITAGIVEAGGDLRTFGEHARNGSWNIGVSHPRPSSGKTIFGSLRLPAGSVATSGDYERFFMAGGRRYHHLLDPYSGYPARGTVSVTIVSKECLLADAYATAVFIMGPEKGLALIESRPDLEGIIIYDEGESLGYLISSGLKDSFTLWNK